MGVLPDPTPPLDGGSAHPFQCPLENLAMLGPTYLLYMLTCLQTLILMVLLPHSKAGYGHVPNPAMPNTFSATAFDLTDYNSPFGSVHIRDKTTVGKRLALGGISQAYGAPDIYWQGPTITSAKAASGGKIILSFNNTGASGLEVKVAVSKLQNGTAWEVCVPSDAETVTTGADACGLLNTNGNGNGWKPATVSGSTASTVTLSATNDRKKTVTSTAAGMLVRYGWAAIPFDYKKAGLYAKSEGLPAGPFVIKVV